ncbi:hypothetical protein GCM10008018_49050 [Paenibacillus marchantiophytorum]|uniref:Uncharacterized protein n=1 Tax=Paenibacillus marchantiophytorum TaxID=1619310 RepID=A0ABQ1F1A3_9BACL|nr:hypothetical protein [Paenibacillus marchantiophytorum]GFZ96849.1 hypothetical protein GCM10008018_49050 [Paenibacillus marchantiophytorum]
MPKAKALLLYHARVKKHSLSGAGRLVAQPTVSIGTDNSWFNAQIIARNLSNETAIVSTRFSISQRRNILAASLFLSVDNYATVIINGVPLVYDAPQNTPAFYNTGRSFNIRQFLRRGRNDIVIIAFNANGQRTVDNPAGVAARLDIRLSSLIN